MDLRITWGGRSRTLHLNAHKLDSPFHAQIVLAGFIEEVAGSVMSWLTEYAKRPKSEWAYERGVQLAQVLYEDAQAAGIDFFDKLVAYAGSCATSSAEDAKRKHTMTSALEEAKPLIRRAISNGCDPQVLLDLINECVVESVLES